MPRKRTTKASNRSSAEGSDVGLVPSKLGDTYVTSTVYDLNDINALEAEIEEKFQELFEELEAKKTFDLKTLNLRLNSVLLSVPENVLNEPIDMNDESLRNIFKSISSQDDAPVENSVLAQRATKRRRSRSVREMQLHDYEIKEINEINEINELNDRTSKKRRSRSLDMYKTPMNKGWLQAFTTAKKYTVSKPAKVEDTGISLKRFMKPNEEAISISGSPLLVQPTVATAPTVNIPLPGGVVMNILPKRTRGNFAVPEFDETTKQQLKMLCQQLNNII